MLAGACSCETSGTADTDVVVAIDDAGALAALSDGAGVAVAVERGGFTVVVVLAESVAVCGDTDSDGASVVGAAEVVALGVGVGVVVGCAAAIPPPVAINTDTNMVTGSALQGGALPECGLYGSTCPGHLQPVSWRLRSATVPVAWQQTLKQQGSGISQEGTDTRDKLDVRFIGSRPECVDRHVSPMLFSRHSIGEESRYLAKMRATNGVVSGIGTCSALPAASRKTGSLKDFESRSPIVTPARWDAPSA